MIAGDAVDAVYPNKIRLCVGKENTMVTVNELKALSKMLTKYYNNLPDETMDDIEFCIAVQSVIDEVDFEILKRGTPTPPIEIMLLNRSRKYNRKD